MSPSVDMSPLAERVLPSVINKVPPVIAAVTVDFDKSVFVMMALFAVMIVVMKPLLLDPMLRVFALREERTDGAKAEARAMQEKAAEILSNYEVQVAAVRAQATADRDALRKETTRLEAEIFAEARHAADLIAQEGRARIETEVASLQKDLEARAAGLAKEIGSSVLGRELS
jgi:F-type H+-transporting ATPase subunit b